MLSFVALQKVDLSIKLCGCYRTALIHPQREREKMLKKEGYQSSSPCVPAFVRQLVCSCVFAAYSAKDMLYLLEILTQIIKINCFTNTGLSLCALPVSLK
ncbi:hypothetical protein ILYODFUR_006039 [Ilyodon furcidens]|uniref:Uncharacterized protein n=1 Tax=Ilyodon furcidens TaxID=33524 RepID=A0ABV0THM0_9TELE